MKQLKSNEIRQMFLDFFKEKDHQIEPSAPLVPIDDPTLLWINSGVATLKKYFDGSVVPANPRLVNAQKAIRTNDIENVGFTARHHTFFEMLGNFSIGEYFKKEAIIWAWEFLTSDKWLGLEEERLSVTVHPEDDEAYELWLNEVKVPKERIIRLEENFWDIGEGPSGPNTEIFYDRGEAFGNDPNDPELYPGGENERYLEVWNLVFSQFNHNPDDTYTPLPNKNIDTGLGLERITSIMQNTKTNFETDLFMPIIKEIENFTNKKYGDDAASDTAFKVIADHIRTVSFAIGDRALPSNEGRGYVLRRLLRRAVRFAKQLGIDKPFMYGLVGIVGEIMKDYYPEVEDQKDHISRIIKVEEERFHETLNEGLSILNEIIKREKAAKKSVIPGEDVFKLYDTYGFPKELTEEYVAEEGFTIDEAGFAKEMEKQQNRAREARENVSSMNVQDESMAKLDVVSTFVGYDETEVNTTVVHLIKDGEAVDVIREGESGIALFAETPFYAESGGQVADTGYVVNTNVTAEVTDVQKSPKGQHLHNIEVSRGEIRIDDEVITMIEDVKRSDIIKNHTATHLLHQALRDEIGTHVTQAGSLVNNERLRFDFTHFEAVTEEQLAAIEQRVNEQIWQALPVTIELKSLDDAKAMGAMALFGEKYDDIVRVVQIGDYSTELCGGCHVTNSEEIGIFKIVAESGIGAGTRRIEAVTSKEAYEFMNDQLALLHEAAALLKTNVNNVPQRVKATLDDVKSLNRLNESLMDQLSHAEAGALADKAEDIDGVSVLLEKVNVKNMNQLRSMLDELKQSMTSSVILLAAENDGKVMLSAGVTKDVIERGIHAGKLIKQAAEICGGGGGGRPDMAQAGGKQPEKIDEALSAAKDHLKENLLKE